MLPIDLPSLAIHSTGEIDAADVATQRFQCPPAARLELSIARSAGIAITRHDGARTRKLIL